MLAQSQYIAAAQDEQTHFTDRTAGDYARVIAMIEATNAIKQREYIERNYPNSTTMSHGKGLINDAINALPMELHISDEGTDGVYRKASFMGPGTQLSKRLKNFNPVTGENAGFITQPINDLDYAAYLHDIAYTKHRDVASRNTADKELEAAANYISRAPQYTATQRATALGVKGIMKAKQHFAV
jgi:hypothetical protein